MESRDIRVTCVGAVLFYSRFNIRIKPVAHYAQHTEYACIGIVLAHCFQELRVALDIILLTVSVGGAIAVIVRTQIYDNQFGLIKRVVPVDILRLFISESAVAETHLLIIERYLLVGLLFAVTRPTADYAPAAY